MVYDGNRMVLRPVLEMINCERIEATIRNDQLWFAGALARQDETHIPQRVTLGKVAAQRPKEAGRPAKHWGDNSQENLRAPRALPRCGAQQAWFIYGVKFNDACDWFTEAKNLGKWYLGVENGGGEISRTPGDAKTNANRASATIERLLRREPSIEELSPLA